MNHRLTRPGVVLIVLAQTTGAVQPPERLLDFPPVGQHLEGPQLLRLADQLQSPAAETLGPADHWLVCPIGPDQPQPREPAHDLGQHELRAGRVLNIPARGQTDLPARGLPARGQTDLEVFPQKLLNRSDPDATCLMQQKILNRSDLAKKLGKGESLQP